MGQVFTAAGKDFHPQFIFKQPNLLADSWLGGKQALCRRRYIEVVMGNFPDISQLLQLQFIIPRHALSEKYPHFHSGASVLDIKLVFFMH